MIHQGPRCVDRERLEVGKEISRAGDVRLRLRVDAAVDRVVGPLEQQALAVRHQLDARVVVFRIEIVQRFARQHHRGRDVVLHLHLVGGIEIRPQLVDPPGAVRIVADAQIVAHQFLVVELQLVAQKAVDAVHGEMLAPVVAPLRLVVALHREDQLADGLRKLAQPGVVLVGVFRRRRQQLDHGAERALRAQDRPPRALVRRPVAVDRGEIPRQDLRHLVHVAVVVLDEHRPFQQHVGDRFRDLRFAAAGDRAGLVAQRSARPRADQPPGRAGQLLFAAGRGSPTAERRRAPARKVSRDSPSAVRPAARSPRARGTPRPPARSRCSDSAGRPRSPRAAARSRSPSRRMASAKAAFLRLTVRSA